MVTRPHIDGVVLLGPAGGHHQLTVAVDLGVLVEFRVDLLFPAAKLRPEIAGFLGFREGYGERVRREFCQELVG